mgnify:FL=1|jgi:dihydrofolate reductase
MSQYSYASTVPGADVELISVAAIAGNRVLGKDGELPWPSIPADKRQYRERIADWPVVLGRRTFDSMRDDLPGTVQIVLSRSESDYSVDSARHASGVDATLDMLEATAHDRAYVIGGAAIYELFQPVVDRMLLSRIPGAYDGDVYFHEWDRDAWELASQTPYEEFTLEEWVRRRE